MPPAQDPRPHCHTSGMRGSQEDSSSPRAVPWRMPSKPAVPAFPTLCCHPAGMLGHGGGRGRTNKGVKSSHGL